MPMADEPPSSPPSASSSAEEALAYYKSQYEHLESELADFQASSRELEAELEKDIDASEKRERKLKEKVEASGYEAEEWKTKYKQAKTEANTVQNTLQKEITTLRDTNRTLQLKLRDIEVANDDFERQARNTTSSLEDMESKYNVAIERGVLLEEEIKNGEQERENLRIEAQRLRDELSDLKIEADIINDKLRKSTANANREIRKPTPLGPGLSVPHSPDHSPGTSASSPIIATPPAKSISSATSDAVTPPSPPVSESSTNMLKAAATPSMAKSKMSVTETGSVARHHSQKPRHSRGPSIPVSNGRSTPSVTSRRSYARMDYNQPSGLPRSGSLYQIRGLIGKMQKLEERVHSARSRLPAPVDTPPRASPRSGSALGHNSVNIPSTVTMRSSRKRTGGSNASYSSSLRDSGATATYATPSRSSFGGIPQPSRSVHGGDSRPSSRTSMSSRSSISGAHSGIPTRPDSRQSLGGAHSGIPTRPDSRQSLGGARTPLGHYSTNPTTESRRPRSSMSNYNNNLSMSHIDEDGDLTTPTPRRSTYNKNDFAGSGIPTPSGLKKRPSESGVSGIAGPRRISSGLDRREGEMAPPERRKKLSGVGETY
ncbi:NADH:ubiquinone oxidoreductase [Arachnomyces sp. PD_36]|nr:NADH:ubiquinone oxidoreductase [Arachnomyces sp. PD_36]